MGIILQFPLSPIAKFRGELVRCHSARMIDRWCERLDKALGKGEIRREDYKLLLDRSSASIGEELSLCTPAQGGRP